MKEMLPVVLVFLIPFGISYAALVFFSLPFAVLVVGFSLTLMFLLAITFGQVMERYNNAQRELALQNDQQLNRIPPPDDYITSLNRTFYGGNR
jgi:uncharacterized membrane protein